MPRMLDDSLMTSTSLISVADVIYSIRTKLLQWKAYIGLCLCAMILVACQPQRPTPLFIPNKVDLSPLINLVWPEHVNDVYDLIDPTMLDPKHFTINEEVRGIFLSYTYQKREVYLEISIRVARDESDALDVFHDECNLSKDEIYLSGSGMSNQGAYQYCIPYLDIQRGGPETGFARGSSYNYWGLALQKGNVVISINEFTETIDRKLTNEAIKQLAVAMTMRDTHP